MRHPASTREEIAQIAGTALERTRARAPRVHCITNNVAQNFTANVLLAIGCVPSMTLSPEEIAAFVAGADALSINLGTLDRARRQAIDIAVETANRRGTPWVLDPAFADRTPTRAEFARELMARSPAVMRLNHAEFSSLAGAEASGEAVAAAAAYQKIVIGLSGGTDLVADGTRVATIANGHPLMARVTAMGCAGSALVAACLAVEEDAWRAAGAALLIFGVAGELAADKAEGPGTFAAAILDALYKLDAATLVARAKVPR
jgi:hydroxyethylthiazole kinase